MGRLEQTQFHKVFVAEVEGRTLVVTPRGDSIGFRDSDVANELNTLLSLIGTPGIVNLVVDLSSAEYFGSTMIGAITQLGTRFREIGGKIALCEISRQMSDMLDIMHLGDLWMKFDTRKIALRYMSKT
jgi:anti-anti-sigma factor